MFKGFVKQQQTVTSSVIAHCRNLVSGPLSTLQLKMTICIVCVHFTMELAGQADHRGLSSFYSWPCSHCPKAISEISINNSVFLLVFVSWCSWYLHYFTVKCSQEKKSLVLLYPWGNLTKSIFTEWTAGLMLAARVMDLYYQKIAH